MKHNITLYKWIGYSVGALLMLAICGFIWVVMTMKKMTSPNVSLRDYREIVDERLERSTHYAVFPRHIDPSLKEIAFYHIPHFMQSHDQVSLRMRLSGEEIAAMVRELEESGRTEIGIEDFGNLSIPKCYPEFGIRRPRGKNLFAGVGELPEGFRIFLYESDLEEIRKKPQHNILSFTAVSTQKQEVVYHVEDW